MSEPTRETTEQLEPSELEREVAVDEVLVMEDRAQVVRRADLELPKGMVSLRIDNLTPLLADTTLRCQLKSCSALGDAEAPRVIDCQVRRRYLVRKKRSEREVEITATIESLIQQYLKEHDNGSVKLRERVLVEQGVKRLASYLGQRLVVGAFDSDCGEDLFSLWERLDELEGELLGLQWSMDDQLDTLARLEEERNEAAQPVSEYRASLFVDMWIPVAGTYELTCEYQVPCALWRPEYLAELLPKDEGAGFSLSWQSFGTVWQKSGEDWQQVRLRFSTARPSLGANLPLLQDDVLTSREKSEDERRTIDVSSRDQTIERVGPPEAREARVDTPPGLADGGEARTYLVPERVDVASNGRPHRVSFDKWAVDSEVSSICLPEKVEAVFVRSCQTNASIMPLLAGPVRLTRNGGYVGRAEIGFIAPGELFELSWGSEDSLVVLREVSRKSEEKGLRRRQHHSFTSKVVISNHGEQNGEVILKERLPVSELEQVEVELDPLATSGDYLKDEQGLLSWNLVLAPGDVREVELAFTVKMPSNVRWEGF